MESRRGFLKKSGMLMLGMTQPVSLAVSSVERPPLWTMVIDLNRCMGCQSCVIACKARSRAGSGVFYTRLVERRSERLPEPKRFFLPVLCNHCKSPRCASACPSDAITKLENGIVMVDHARCTGSGKCVSACPFGAIQLDPFRGNKAYKCDFCLERVEAGLMPACVEACPSQARLFGDLNRPQGEFAAYIRHRMPRSAGKLGPRIIYIKLEDKTGSLPNVG